jgi:hypothetical protein
MTAKTLNFSLISGIIIVIHGFGGSNKKSILSDEKIYI